MVWYWVFVLALSVLLYVLLDGFDLGIGILFGLTRDEAKRRAMMATVAPVWDGNETWLVVAGVVLWGAFPVVYATLFSAFYLALLLMLAGLILRGVAFEFRYKAERMRPVWDLGFAGGSLVAAFIQGMMVGALVEGLPIANGQYVGGEFGWLSAFSLMCGVGLCLGYALLGACWLVRKGEGELRESAYRLIPYLVYLPDRRLRLCACRKSSRHQSLAGTSLFVRLPGDRCRGRDRARAQRPQAPARAAVLHGLADLCRGVWDARHLVLAVHDSVLNHH
jgi:cytochrome bd-type quinol oxidase subunit 2